MKVVYIADDGKEFDDEYACMDYEWKLSHFLDGIIFYDENGKLLTNPYADETYNKVNTIEVKNEEALKTLHEIADYNGFCLYYDIDSVGKWVFYRGKEWWVGGFKKEGGE